MLLDLVLTEADLSTDIVLVDSKVEFERALSEGEFDLIISDSSIPGYNGFSALTASATRLPGTPFIILSGTFRKEAAAEALKAGADDYIVKDRPDLLLAAIHRCFE